MTKKVIEGKLRLPKLNLSVNVWNIINKLLLKKILICRRKIEDLNKSENF